MGLLVFGSANADRVLRVWQLPRARETVQGGGGGALPGGKGLDQAVAATVPACAKEGAAAALPDAADTDRLLAGSCPTR